jgi:hypothetical protein
MDADEKNPCSYDAYTSIKKDFNYGSKDYQ